jgi:hypothetical protein
MRRTDSEPTLANGREYGVTITPLEIRAALTGVAEEIYGV